MATNYRKKGSTELETVTVSATGLANLGSVSAATWYQQSDAGVLKVDGGAMVVSDSAALELTFDPVGVGVGATDAFDTVATYHVYVKLVHTDGDITRHPDKGYEVYVVEASFE